MARPSAVYKDLNGRINRFNSEIQRTYRENGKSKVKITKVTKGKRGNPRFPVDAARALSFHRVQGMLQRSNAIFVKAVTFFPKCVCVSVNLCA